MKKLYLVRHAKSSWDNPKLDDFDRPLNPRGEKNAPQMGKRLRKKGIKPDLLLASPANRAFTTAKKIAKAIGYPVDSIQTSMDIYHAGENRLLEIVQQQDDAYSTLMLFGHNPSFTWFANSLSGVNIENIPTAGVVAIHFNCDSWNQIHFGGGKMEFFDYPKKPD